MNEELRTISERLDRIEAWAGIGQKEVLTIQEASVYTGYAVATLQKYTQSAIVPHYRRNGRVFFRKAELDGWMTERRVRTVRETEALAASMTVPGARRKPGRPKSAARTER